MSGPIPFTPTFGVTPPVLVGRRSIIREADEAITDGPGAPDRAMLIRGAGGTSKTATLNAIEDQAHYHGRRTPGLACVGHRLWRYAGDSATITATHANRAIPEASTRLGDLVHAPAVQALSSTDRRYLQAMARDDGASTSANIYIREQLMAD
ncbi:hypothetical protein [Cryobacterium sp. Y50]|uniref:hypothetical protein n=1 Tax=Cryobacterium sp. Y50 TaxID=2048286 RepID=UPI000CE4917E|nr:hypothetical protein [Cryobacterium sp. Y50]